MASTPRLASVNSVGSMDKEVQICLPICSFKCCLYIFKIQLGSSKGLDGSKSDARALTE